MLKKVRSILIVLKFYFKNKFYVASFIQIIFQNSNKTCAIFFYI